ncbi:DUF305 domain-containing protein [Rhizobium leguminosarum]|nr:DUF305 domain-containing protein [Rhizobium leguminosarum]
MAAHHKQGLLVAQIVAERATDPHLRTVAKLMAASQRGVGDLHAVVAQLVCRSTASAQFSRTCRHAWHVAARRARNIANGSAIGV